MQQRFTVRALMMVVILTIYSCDKNPAAQRSAGGKLYR